MSAQGNALVVPHKFARAAEPRFKDPEPNRWARNGTRWYERGAWPRPWRRAKAVAQAMLAARQTVGLVRRGEGFG